MADETLGDALVAENYRCDSYCFDDYMFVRRASDGKWYTYESFFEHYGVARYPSHQEKDVPEGRWKTCHLLRQEIKNLKFRRSTCKSHISRARYLEQQRDLSEELKKNEALYYKREAATLPYWNAAISMRKHSVQNLRYCAWAWDLGPHPDAEQHDDDQGTEPPFKETMFHSGMSFMESIQVSTARTTTSFP